MSSRRKTDQSAGHNSVAQEGDLRVGAVLSIPSLVAEYGVDPSRVLAKVGLDIRLFDDPENRVPFGALGRLVDACVTATGCPHFGLLLGQRFDANTLGALGYLLSNSRTVGDALHSVVKHLHVHDRGGVPSLIQLDSRRVKLAYTIYYQDVPATAQLYDLAVTVGHRLMRKLCGPTWKPIAVMLSHGEPRHVAPFEQCFGVRPQFNARLSALVFSTAWLDRTIKGADPVLHDIIAKAIAQQEASELFSFAVQVRRALCPMVYSGNASLAALCRLFGLQERTLRRRLDAEGTSVHQLVNEARFEVARQLLRDTRLPLAKIAALLHYSGAAAFSRAFRGLAHMSPREWRVRHGSGPTLPA